jgi:predicted phage terminase large subunit-like protein
MVLSSISAASLGQHRRDIERSLAEERLINFIRLMWPVVEPGRPFTRGWAIDAICEHLEAVTNGDIKRLLINVPPGFMKPVYSRSMVVERKRGRIELRDVKVGDYVLTHRGRFRRVDAVHEQGVLPLLKITTRRGHVLKLAHDHPVLTARGWIQAQHVTTADVLAEVHASEPCGTETMTAEEARLLGYLIGDGSVKYGDKSFTNNDPQTLADFAVCAHSMGFATYAREVRIGTTKVTIKSGQAREVLHRKGSTGPVKRWLLSHDLDGKCSYDKRVPDAIFAASEDLIAEFISAYWSCDGTIHDRRDLPRAGRAGQTTQVVRVECSTVSEALARGLQHLLTRLGLSFTVRRKVTQLKTRAQGDLYVSWEVRATDQDTVARFMEIMRPLLRHEKSTRGAGVVRTKFDATLIPNEVIEIDAIDAAECRCLTVREDHSFTAEDHAVHNSLATCVFWPAWEWGPRNRADLRYLFASYVSSLSVANNMKLRRLIESPAYRELWGDRVVLQADQNAKTMFENTRMGFALATSVGGAVMGKRGDRAILDDPNNTKDVDSDAKLEEALQFVTEVLPTRMNDEQTFAQVTIMQRTGERDVAGHLIANKLIDAHLCIPMEFRRGHPFISYADKPTLIGWIDPRTEDGELAFPERFGAEGVERLKREFRSHGGDYAEAGQLDQLPVPRGGGLFQEEWLDRECEPEEVPTGGVTARGWDFAGSKGKRSPYTASCKLRLAPDGTLYLLDVTRVRVESAQLEQHVADVTAGDDRDVIVDMPQDPGQAGKAQVAAFAKKLIGRVLLWSPESGSKEVRAAPIASQAKAKNLVIVRGEWNREFKNEAKTFPRGMFKDQIDALSRAFARLLASGGAETIDGGYTG